MQKRNTSTQNDYMVCLEGSTPPHKKVPPLFFDLPYDEFKTPSPPPLCSSKPHKYDNYAKAPCTVFSYL